MTAKQRILAEMEKFPEEASAQVIISTLRDVLFQQSTSNVHSEKAAAALVRPFGSCKGEFTMPDDFDDPLPDDIQAAFEGRSQEE